MIDRWEEVRSKLLTSLDDVGYLTLSSYYPKEKTSTQIGKLDPHDDQAIAILIAGPPDLLSDGNLDAVRASMGQPSVGYGDGTLVHDAHLDVDADVPDEDDPDEDDPDDEPDNESVDDDDEDSDNIPDDEPDITMSASKALDGVKARHAKRRKQRLEEEGLSFTIEERVEGVRLWLNACARSNTAPGTRGAFRLRAHQLKGTPLWSIIVSYNALNERFDDAEEVGAAEALGFPRDTRPPPPVPMKEQVAFLASPPPAVPSNTREAPGAFPSGFLPRAKTPDQAMRLASIQNTEIVTLNAMHATTRELMAMVLNATSTITNIQGRALKQTASALEDAREHNAQLLEMIGVHRLAEAELLAKTKLAEVGEGTKETLGTKAIEQLGAIGRLLVKGRQAMGGAQTGASPIEAAGNALDAASEPDNLGEYLHMRPDVLVTLNDPHVRAYLRDPSNVVELRGLAKMMTGTEDDAARPPTVFDSGNGAGLVMDADIYNEADENFYDLSDVPAATPEEDES